MPRQPKPFIHRGCWVTDIGGSRTKLAQGREKKKDAEQAFYEMLAKRGSDPEAKTVPQLAVWELCEQFLDWVKLHRSAGRFADYHHYLAGPKDKRWAGSSCTGRNGSGTSGRSTWKAGRPTS